MSFPAIFPSLLLQNFTITALAVPSFVCSITCLLTAHQLPSPNVLEFFPVTWNLCIATHGDAKNTGLYTSGRNTQGWNTSDCSVWDQKMGTSPMSTLKNTFWGHLILDTVPDAFIFTLQYNSIRMPYHLIWIIYYHILSKAINWNCNSQEKLHESQSNQFCEPGIAYKWMLITCFISFRLIIPKGKLSTCSWEYLTCFLNVNSFKNSMEKLNALCYWCLNIILLLKTYKSDWCMTKMTWSPWLDYRFVSWL